MSCIAADIIGTIARWMPWQGIMSKAEGGSSNAATALFFFPEVYSLLQVHVPRVVICLLTLCIFSGCSVYRQVSLRVMTSVPRRTNETVWSTVTPDMLQLDRTRRIGIALGAPQAMPGDP
jgi:hypothetical protein